MKFKNKIGDSKEEKERLDGTASRRKIASSKGKHGEKDGESGSPVASQTNKRKSANICERMGRREET